MREILQDTMVFASIEHANEPSTNPNDGLQIMQQSFLTDELESLVYQNLGNSWVDPSTIHFAKVLIVLFVKHNVRKCMECLEKLVQLTANTPIVGNDLDTYMAYSLKCISQDVSMEQTFLDLEEFRVNGRLRTNSVSVVAIQY